MKTVLCLVVCVLVFGVSALAQSVDSGSALRLVVETERAFAKASEEQGTREAFLSFIADDGVLFRPAAVNGKKWMNENPLPPSPKRGLLSWRPIFADVALAGDLGYTTGPWEFKQDIKDEKPVAYGNFVTVWKKQADDSWKFVVDLGITNPQPASAPGAWQPPANMKSKKPVMIDVASGESALIRREREFSNASAKRGALKTFLSYSADDLRLFRNDSFPFVGRDAAGQALATNQNVWTWQPTFADVSRSGELGYVYGTYELRSNDAAKALTEKGNYLRIWKKQNGAWKVVLDVANPLPPEQKKN